jgi:hypothetical protein
MLTKEIKLNSRICVINYAEKAKTV